MKKKIIAIVICVSILSTSIFGSYEKVRAFDVGLIGSVTYTFFQSVIFAVGAAAGYSPKYMSKTVVNNNWSTVRVNPVTGIDGSTVYKVTYVSPINTLLKADLLPNTSIELSEEEFRKEFGNTELSESFQADVATAIGGMEPDDFEKFRKYVVSAVSLNSASWSLLRPLYLNLKKQREEKEKEQFGGGGTSGAGIPSDGFGIFKGGKPSPSDITWIEDNGNTHIAEGIITMCNKGEIIKGGGSSCRITGFEFKEKYKKVCLYVERHPTLDCYLINGLGLLPSGEIKRVEGYVYSFNYLIKNGEIITSGMGSFSNLSNVDHTLDAQGPYYFAYYHPVRSKAIAEEYLKKGTLPADALWEDENSFLSTYKGSYAGFETEKSQGIPEKMKTLDENVKAGVNASVQDKVQGKNTADKDSATQTYISSLVGTQVIDGSSGTDDVPREEIDNLGNTIVALLRQISKQIDNVGDSTNTSAFATKIDELINEGKLTREQVISLVNDKVTELLKNKAITKEQLVELVADEQAKVDEKTAAVLAAISSKLNLNNFVLPSGIGKKFPFCIPFDLINCIKLFQAPSRLPEIKFNFELKTAKVKKEIVLDLSFMDNFMKGFRTLLLLMFVLVLIKTTRTMIKG